ncbi:hypothetical protein [Bacillus infantis]|nr:hypothetical protein [Bacillus infantis]
MHHELPDLLTPYKR